MGRKNLSEIRKEEIVKAFYKVAKDTGLENASIAKIAEEMSMSKGNILHYFESKDKLFLALNDYILNEYLSFINLEKYNNVNSKELLVEIITVLFSRTWDSHIDDGVFYSFYAQIYRNDILKNSFKYFFRTIHNSLKIKLLSASKNNIIKNENIDELTEIIFTLIHGSYYYLGAFLNEKTTYNTQLNFYINYALSLIDFEKD